jgi:hypothetical protein
MWGDLPREKTWSIEEKSQGETRLSHSTPTTTCVVNENPDIQRRQIYHKVGDCKITGGKGNIIATSILSIVSDKRRL